MAQYQVRFRIQSVENARVEAQHPVVAGIGYPEVSLIVEGNRPRTVHCGPAGGGCVVVECGLAVHHVGFHARGVGEGVRKAQDTVVTHVGDIEVSRRRIHSHPQRTVESFRADSKRSGIPRTRLAKNDRRRISVLVCAYILPGQNAVILRIGYVEMRGPAPVIQGDARGIVHLEALHQVDAVLAQIGLPERAVGALGNLRRGGVDSKKADKKRKAGCEMLMHGKAPHQGTTIVSSACTRMFCSGCSPLMTAS